MEEEAAILKYLLANVKSPDMVWNDRHKPSFPYRSLLGVIDTNRYRGRVEAIRLAKDDVPMALKEWLSKELHQYAPQLFRRVKMELNGDANELLLPVLRYVSVLIPQQEIALTPPQDAASPSRSASSKQLRYRVVSGTPRGTKLSPPIHTQSLLNQWIWWTLTSCPDTRGSMTVPQAIEFLSDSSWDAMNRAALGKFLQLLRHLSMQSRERHLIILDPRSFASQFSALRPCRTRTDIALALSMSWSKLRDAPPWNCFETVREAMNDIQNRAYTFSHAEWEFLFGAGYDVSHIVLERSVLKSRLNGFVPRLFCSEQMLKVVFHLFDIRFPLDVLVNEEVSFLESSRLNVCVVWAQPRRHLSKCARVVIQSARDDKCYRCLFTPLEADKLKRSLGQEGKLPSYQVAAQRYLAKEILPTGLITPQKGQVALENDPRIALRVDWYTQANGLVDVEMLFVDAFDLLRSGGPPTHRFDSKEMSFGELVLGIGFDLAFDMVLRNFGLNHTLPEGVVPLFIPGSLPVASQDDATQIYFMTGRFRDRIYGFRDKTSGECVFLRDVCATRRRGGELNFSKLKASVIQANVWLNAALLVKLTPLEFCLLKVSLFRELTPSLEHLLDRTRLRVSSSDLELIELERSASTIALRPISQFQALVDESLSNRDLMLTFFHQYALKTSPFVVVNGDEINRRLSYQVLTGERASFSPNDMVRVPLGVFRRWISKQTHVRKRLMPRLPCLVQLRHSRQIAELKVFDESLNEWTIWHPDTKTQAVYERTDFDILEDDRVLPAKVDLLDEDGSAGALAVARYGNKRYKVELSNGSVRVATLHTDFEWAETVYVDRETVESVVERPPAMEVDMFNEDSSLRFKSMENEIMPLPEASCQDWVLRDFFSERGRYSVWRFLRFMELSDTDRAVLYEAFDQCDADAKRQESSGSWVDRAKRQISDSCWWIWNRLDPKHPESWKFRLNHRVWHEKFPPQCVPLSREAFRFVMDKLYTTT